MFSHLNSLHNLLLEKMASLTPAVSQSVVYARTTDGREEGQIKDFIQRKLVHYLVLSILDHEVKIILVKSCC